MQHHRPRNGTGLHTKLNSRGSDYNEYASNGATVAYTRSTTFYAGSRILGQSGSYGTSTYYYAATNADGTDQGQTCPVVR